MNTELKVYIRIKDRKPNTEDRTPIGMVISKKQPNGKVTVGWSLCMKKDKYDEAKGYLKASKRQYSISDHKFTPTLTKATSFNSQSDEVIYVPQTAWKTVEKMIARSQKYFKTELPF